MKPIRIAVVGLGFGQFHVQSLADMPEARLVAVAEAAPRMSEGLDAYAARYGATPYRDSAEMLQREQLDAVVIATSPKHRAAVIAQALEHDAAMFIEKPWASTLDQGRELAALCARAARPVMTGFSFRFHPALVRLRELLDGELGRPWQLHGSYVFDFLPPETAWLWDPANGNGLFNENSCHLFDAVCHLMGRPLHVMAQAANFAGRPSEEAAAVTIGFEGGAVASLAVGGYGAAACEDYPRIELYAEGGQARMTGRQHVWESLAWARRGEGETRNFSSPPELLGATRYTHALRHFLACCASGDAPTATVADGLRSVALAEAVYASARNARQTTVEAIDC